ncbi:MAG: class I SAM-dependent methyltransferase [Candidatus Uhrbacteria bacterium]
MTKEFGKKYWDVLWEKLEQEGNVGLDYVINPYFYPEIISLLAQTPRALVVDFGCGTNLMGIQLLYGYSDSIAALKNTVGLDHARFNTMLYLGIEGQNELVKRLQSYIKDLGKPTNIATVEARVEKIGKNFFDAKSIDLCVSRNFLMHLSVADYKKHIDNVHTILKKGGSYVFAILNPAYECLKVGRELKNNERYDFSHGRRGEHGTFYHYYKTLEQYESVMSEFKIIKRISCYPVSEQFRSTHKRYYNPTVPMALVYVLEKN